MTIVGFNFNKINAEKKKPIKGKVDIKSNVLITGVKESKLPVDGKRKPLNFEFEFTVVYEPGFGSIKLHGEILFLLDNKVADDTLKVWKKDKKVKGDFLSGIMNHILAKSNIQAVVVSRDVGLPAPLPLPKVK